MVILGSLLWINRDPAGLGYAADAILMTDTDMVEPYSSTTGITFFGTFVTAIPEINIKSSLVKVGCTALQKKGSLPINFFLE